MMSDFRKGLFQIIGEDDEFAFALHLLDASAFSFDECVQLRRRNPIFTPSVVGRFHLHRTQRNNGGACEDADVFASHRRAQPFAEVLLCVGNRESRHMNY